MQRREQIPEPWRSFLGELDREAAEETRLDCMGGFVVTQLYGFARETADLDVLQIAPGEQRSRLFEIGKQGGALHKRYKVYLDHVGVAKVPEDHEDRLTEMFPAAYERLRICALDPYDLALSKLERNIQRDRDDVKHLARTIPLDVEKLKTLRKRVALATGNSGTGRFDIENVDRDDPGVERNKMSAIAPEILA